MIAPALCVGLIPARLQSTRLPGKPLALIANIPMIVHVATRAKMAKSLDSVVVCTDSSEIVDTCHKFGIQSCLTKTHHLTGTDRIGEAIDTLKIDSRSIVIDIQGDEPLINPDTIDELVQKFLCSDFEIMLPYIDFHERNNINVVKIVETKSRILFMSREDIPSSGFNPTTMKKHLSIIAFRPQALKKFCQCAPSELEKIENIELLRAIENHITIGTFRAQHESFSVDIPSDLDRANRLMPHDRFYQEYNTIKNLSGSNS